MVVSGCSGGGKSSLIEELSRRGFAIVTEPGRRIVEGESDPESAMLPWNDLASFARKAADLARTDHAAVAAIDGPVFFDRGLIDALSALSIVGGAAVTRDAIADCPYDEDVFLVPPWPEIWTSDASRRHGMAEAVEEYGRLLQLYAALGFRTHIMARASIAERADAVLAIVEREEAKSHSERERP